jgi:acyl-coenzyme A synthetase/AMP-(fatty) acid ligase
MLLSLPKKQINDCKLRFVQSCGSPLNPNLLLTLERWLNVPIITSYTMSEACHLITSNLPEETRKLDSVGQPIGVQVCVIDENGTKVSQGLGEVCIHGPTVFKGTISTN